MDETQERFERTVGDAFVQWYNQITGAHFSFSARPKEAPDLIYSDGPSALLIEIGGAYPGKEEAAFWWQNLRKVQNAPQQVSGKDMDESLIADINRRIEEKCGKSYGSECLLVVYVHPAMTTAEEVQERLDQIKLPERNPFRAMFLTGHFPMSSSGSVGGYRCWRLFGKLCPNTSLNLTRGAGAPLAG